MSKLPGFESIDYVLITTPEKEIPLEIPLERFNQMRRLWDAVDVVMEHLSSVITFGKLLPLKQNEKYTYRADYTPGAEGDSWQAALIALAELIGKVNHGTK